MSLDRNQQDFIYTQQKKKKKERKKLVKHAMPQMKHKNGIMSKRRQRINKV